MKAKFRFEIMELDDGKVAVPVGEGAETYNGVLKVNETAAAILKYLAEDTKEEKIVEALVEEYSGDKAEIARYTHEFIEKLIAEGIVDY